MLIPHTHKSRDISSTIVMVYQWKTPGYTSALLMQNEKVLIAYSISNWEIRWSRKLFAFSIRYIYNYNYYYYLHLWNMIISKFRQGKVYSYIHQQFTLKYFGKDNAYKSISFIRDYISHALNCILHKTSMVVPPYGVITVVMMTCVNIEDNIFQCLRFLMISQR